MALYVVLAKASLNYICSTSQTTRLKTYFRESVTFRLSKILQICTECHDYLVAST